MKMLNNRIAFIGTGFMASAMIGGLVRSGTFSPENIFAVNDAFPESAAEAAEKFGIVRGDASSLELADIVLFAVKPQSLPDVLEMYKERLSGDKLYLSIMAGISTSYLENALNGARVIRFMPNLALSVSCSATAYCLGSRADESDGALAEEIFSPMGIIRRVKEEEISAVTALSGSGPAYFYRLTEAMAKAAIDWGMEAAAAEELALHTLIGSAKLIAQTGESPSEMRRRVTSKGGTTAAALDAMTETGFDDSVASAFSAARIRSDELGK